MEFGRHFICTIRRGGIVILESGVGAKIIRKGEDAVYITFYVNALFLKDKIKKDMVACMLGSILRSVGEVKLIAGRKIRRW